MHCNLSKGILRLFEKKQLGNSGIIHFHDREMYFHGTGHS